MKAVAVVRYLIVIIKRLLDVFVNTSPTDAVEGNNLLRIDSGMLTDPVQQAVYYFFLCVQILCQEKTNQQKNKTFFHIENMGPAADYFTC
jgi:hypothetical protein